MLDFKKHIVKNNISIKGALSVLDTLAPNMIVFVTNENDELLGTVTDGDIRRGLLKGCALEDSVMDIINTSYVYIEKGVYDYKVLDEIRKKAIGLIPILSGKKIFKLVSFADKKSLLPLESVIMAGGKGTRLMPLTKDIPKPLLKVGDKPIIEYNIDRLNEYGIDSQYISVKHFGDQIEDYFKDGSDKGISIKYIWEDEPLGTLGAVGLVNEFVQDYILVMNSDLLTNIDYEAFFRDFIDNDADMAVASIPYDVNIPYAVLESEDKFVKNFKEKPTYTYYSNAGIYLFKREVFSRIPKNKMYNATDMMEELIADGKKVLTFPIYGYWLDVGKHEDFNKAQEDIKYIKL